MNFAVYSKEGCPYCEKIKKVLDLTKTSYVVYNLGEHFDKKSFYDEFGEGSTFPQVIVDGQRIGGCIDSIKFLQEKKVINVWDK